MRRETVNKVKDNIIHGDFVGRDNFTVNIVMYQESEREFVVTHNANIKPVSYFTGRETELQELRQRIEEGRKSVLVSGMGGIGKTHVCRKLFEEYYNRHGKGEDGPFRYIGYIEYDGDMDSSLQNCLKFKQQDNPEQNQGAAWRELEYLASDGKLLLFVDNVDKPMSEDTGLQKLNTIPGAIILTSRRTSLGKEFEPYRIGFLCMEQCKEIYERIRYDGSKVLDEEISDLEYVIGTLAARHTITIEFLANLAKTKSWGVKKLLEELQEKGFCLGYKDDEEKLVNIQKSYEALYDLSKLTEAEQNILEAFSVFPYIPLAADVCNQWLLSDAGVSGDDDILVGLYRKGWLQFDTEQESYTMHPVFAQFIYEKYKPKAEEHDGLIEACKKSLKILNNGSVFECQKYIPFVEKMIENLCIKKDLKRARLLAVFGNLLKYMAEYKKAEKVCKEYLKICKSKLGENNKDTSDGYNNLAHIYMEQGEYERAESFYKKSLTIRKKVLIKNHPLIAASYNNLAGVYRNQGKYDKAKDLYQKSMEIREKVLGKEHPETAAVYNNLAHVYIEQNEYEKAEKLYIKCLIIRKKVLPKDHPYIAASYNNLAGAYKNQRKLEKAKELYEKSLDIRKRVLGEEHPETAAVYNNLGHVYKEQEEYEKAERLYKKSLDIRKKALPKDHPYIAASYVNLATLYNNQGKFQIAMEYYLKGYKKYMTKLGADHFRTQGAFNRIKQIYKECNLKGNFEQWLEEQMKE